MYLPFDMLVSRFSVALEANFKSSGGVRAISSKSDSILGPYITHKPTDSIPTNTMTNKFTIC